MTTLALGPFEEDRGVVSNQGGEGDAYTTILLNPGGPFAPFDAARGQPGGCSAQFDPLEG